MLQIAHFSQDFRRGKSQLGAFSRIWNLTADDNSHTVFTLHYGDTGVQDFARGHLRVVSLGVDVKRLRWWNRPVIARALGRRITEWCQRNNWQPDVFFGHSQLFNHTVMRSARTLLRSRAPLLWEANAIAGSQIADGSRHPAHFWFAAHQRHVFRNSDMIVAQTERSKKTISRWFGVPERRIHVVPNGVDSNSARDRKTYVDFHDGAAVIGFVGLFDTLNGTQLALSIADELAPAWRLRFIGDGAYAPAVRGAADRGLIEYHGAVPYEKMPSELLELDVLLVPRAKCFGSDHFIPTKLLEAMALGVVVVASDVDGITEVVEDGINGFLFKAGSKEDLVAKLRLVRNLPMSRLEEVSRCARRAVLDRYAWTQHHATLSRIYQTAIQTAKTSRGGNAALEVGARSGV